jgi:chaperonin GroES
MSTASMAKPTVKIQPLGSRVVIQPDDEAETMRGPLYLPDTAKEKPTQGKVLAVGPGRLWRGERVKPDVQVGDTVIYGQYSGVPYRVGDDHLVIIKASDILAKIG